MGKQVKEIVIVDDDEDTRKMLRKILENSGFKVYSAQGVDEAFQLVMRRVPHLVILDLVLSGETGFTYLEKHRKEPALSHVPVIVLSSLRQKPAIYQAVSLGAFDYLAKPVEPAILVQKIKKAMKDRQFPVVQVPEGPHSKVTLRTVGQIIMANENGFLLEASIRIAEDSKLNISSPLLRTLACETAVFQRSRQVAVPGHAGQYLNDISAIGLSPSTAMRIRKLVQEWK